MSNSKKFEEVLKNLGGTMNYVNGQNEFWTFPSSITHQDIYLKLDRYNDSFLLDFEISDSTLFGSNTKIFFKYLEE